VRTLRSNEINRFTKNAKIQHSLTNYVVIIGFILIVFGRGDVGGKVTMFFILCS